MFGVDIIAEEKTGRLFLQEINARQPASTTFESQLQQKSEVRNQKSEITTFEAHLASLLNLPNDNYTLISIHDGAQIIQRVTNQINKPQAPKLKTARWLILLNNNTSPIRSGSFSI